MYKILIDTTDRFNRSVTLLKDDKTLDTKEGEIDIADSIQTLLKSHSLDITQINEFYAHPGPGSFTGIKVGLSYSNIMNWALGKKSIKDLQTAEYGGEPNISKPKTL